MTRHFNKGMFKKLICFLSIACILASLTPNTFAKSSRDYVTMNADQYRYTLAKGFLGKAYRTKIDGIRCDCSGYAKVALNRMKSTTTEGGSFKKYHVNARSTAAWVAGSKVSFIGGSMNTNNKLTWNKKKTTIKIGKTSTGSKKLSKLSLGDVVVYKKGGSSNHIAVYFGKFKSAAAVKNYLVSIGVYKKGALKKTSSGKYTYKGKTIIRSYGKSNYWRIHSTNSGILIDNDINGKSPYTSSYGKWKWTFETGISCTE